MEPITERTERAAKRAAERAADRDTLLAAYRPADLTHRAEVTELDTADPTVTAFLAAAPAQEAGARLALLAQFCDFVGESPATMIATIFDRESYRYVRRAYFEQQILAWSAAADGDWAARTATGDVIRDFFRANGHTIAPVVPSWHLWLRMG